LSSVHKTFLKCEGKTVFLIFSTPFFCVNIP